MTNMATTLIYGKRTLKDFFSKPNNQWTWNSVCSIGYISTTKIVQWRPLVDIDLFWGKVKKRVNSNTQDLLDRFEDFGLKIGNYSCRSKYMKIYEYKKSMSFFDPGFSLYDYFKHLFKSHLASWNKISYTASLGWGNKTFFKQSRSQNQHNLYPMSLIDWQFRTVRFIHDKWFVWPFDCLLSWVIQSLLALLLPLHQTLPIKSSLMSYNKNKYTVETKTV